MRWQRWALNFGAVLGSLCLILAALTFLFGLKPLIFASGSMGPQIPTGSLGIAVPTPVAEVSPGQVVSVVTSEGTRITHRVLENRPEGLVLKGDANPVADLQPYAVADADRLLFSVPLLGYMVGWFSQPWAFFLGGMLCAYLLYLAFFRRNTSTPFGERSPGDADDFPNHTNDSVRSRDKNGKRTRNRAWMRSGAAVTALAVVVPLGIAIGVEPTRAAFIAEAQAGAAMAAPILPAVGNPQCESVQGEAKKIRFLWDKPSAIVSGQPQLKGYVVTVQRNNGANPPTMIGTETRDSLGPEVRVKILDASESNGTLGKLLVDLLQLLVGFNYTYTVKITAQYGTADWAWDSQPYVNNNVSVSAGILGSNLTVRCPK